jgi:predicted  nucleic acid-binding Zn-ribbon protein
MARSPYYRTHSVVEDKQIEIDELKEQIKALELELVESKAQIVADDVTIYRLKNDRIKLIEEVDTLKDRIETLESQNRK